MFDGKVFRSVYKLDEVEIKALPYYFEKLKKECKTKSDLCKHCEFYGTEKGTMFMTPCHFCIGTTRMQFQPINYELYDEAFKQGITALLIN